MNEVVIREWSGSADAVRRALEIAEGRGQLVSVEPLRAGPRGVAVRVVLRPSALTRTPTPPRQTPTRPRQRRWVRWAIGSTAALLLLGAIVWLVVEAVAWAFAHVAQILGVLGGGAFLLFLAGQAGVCPGVHCPGCRHR